MYDVGATATGSQVAVLGTYTVLLFTCILCWLALATCVVVLVNVVGLARCRVTCMLLVVTSVLVSVVATATYGRCWVIDAVYKDRHLW